MPKPSRPSTRHIHRSSPTLLHHGVQLLVEVLRLLVQRVELQQTLAEQTRLAQLAQLVVGVGNVVDAFVGLESVINQGYALSQSGGCNSRKFRRTSPARTFLCFSPRRTRN